MESESLSWKCGPRSTCYLTSGNWVNLMSVSNRNTNDTSRDSARTLRDDTQHTQEELSVSGGSRDGRPTSSSRERRQHLLRSAWDIYGVRIKGSGLLLLRASQNKKVERKFRWLSMSGKPKVCESFLKTAITSCFICLCCITSCPYPESECRNTD